MADFQFNDFANWLVLVVAAAYFLERFLFWLYQWQVKEYRTDRFWVFVREVGMYGVLKLLFLPQLRRPAKSPRNLAISFLGFLCLAVAVIFSASRGLGVALIFLLLAPVMAFVLATLGVAQTWHLAYFQRRRIINRAAAKVKQSKALFIGVTGSFGKSSTKEFLARILSAHYQAAQTEGNYNTDVGIALSVNRNLRPETEYFVAEMAAYKKGEIARSCALAKPKYGILTGLGNQHLALFGSRESLVSAKGELLRALPADGVAYINADSSDYEKAAAGAKCQVVYYSREREMLLWGKVGEISADGINFQLFYRGQTYDFQTKLLGEYQLSNLLPAIGLALELGVPYEKIRETVGKIRPLAGKLSLESGLNGCTVLNDSYNSNAEGFIAAIRTAVRFPQARKIVISKGIIELGASRDDCYRRILGELRQAGLTLCTTDPLLKKLSGEAQVMLFSGERALGERLIEEVDGNTLLVIEGRFSPCFIQQLVK